MIHTARKTHPTNHAVVKIKKTIGIRMIVGVRPKNELVTFIIATAS